MKPVYPALKFSPEKKDGVIESDKPMSENQGNKQYACATMFLSASYSMAY